MNRRRKLLQAMGLAGLASLLGRKRASAQSFPFPVSSVPGAKALETWQRIRGAGNGWPVILGGDQDMLMLAEPLIWRISGAPDTAEILRRAEGYRFPKDYRERIRQGQTGLSTLLASPDLATLSDAIDETLREQGALPTEGPWPAVPPSDPGLTVASKFDFVGTEMRERRLDHVWIATLPVQHWTEIFARLRYGGWNACPFPHEHVAAFRHWTARYDLELVGMTFDTLNLRPRRHPASKDEALSLAYEQYEFCPDLVDQGIPLVDLAAGLMAGNWWYFWWD